MTDVSAESISQTDSGNLLYRGMDWFGVVAPGLLLAGVLAWIGTIGADWFGKSVLGFTRSPVSAILVTILLGLFVRNVIGLPEAYESGLKLCVKRILRIGIVILGLRLSLVAIAQISAIALPIVIGTIASAIIFIAWLARTVKLPLRMGTLIAVGTSICGVSAIVATGPAIDAEEDEISYAVACITLFGSIAIFTYPFLGHWIFDGIQQQAGLFLGTAIHDTAQVAGASLSYEQQYAAPEAMAVAMTTKLVRNLCMGVTIPFLAVFYHRQRAAMDGSGKEIGKWHKYVPLFIVGFVAMAAVRSIGDLGDRPFGVINPAYWKTFLGGAKEVSVACLTIAMAGVGLGTNVSRLKKLGCKPLFVGLTATLLVGFVSIGLIKLVAAFVG